MPAGRSRRSRVSAEQRRRPGTPGGNPRNVRAQAAGPRVKKRPGPLPQPRHPFVVAPQLKGLRYNRGTGDNVRRDRPWGARSPRNVNFLH